MISKQDKYKKSRALPDFLIIGAQKSGTTSLYEYLREHPHVIPASKKEIHFFDTKFYKGNRWYQSHFPKRKELTNKITGEASPSYLFYPNSAKRIYNLIPDVKLIVLLRNPVDRAISSYFHQQQKGREKLSLEKALDAEEERLAKFKRKLGYGLLSSKSSKKYRQFSYKERGLYAQQLRTFFQYFPKEQIWIEQAERFFTETQNVLQEVFEFLHIDNTFTPDDLNPRNVHHYDQISPKIRKKLYDYYQQPNKELFQLIGKKFDW